MGVVLVAGCEDRSRPHPTLNTSPSFFIITDINFCDHEHSLRKVALTLSARENDPETATPAIADRDEPPALDASSIAGPLHHIHPSLTTNRHALTTRGSRCLRLIRFAPQYDVCRRGRGPYLA